MLTMEHQAWQRLVNQKCKTLLDIFKRCKSNSSKRVRKKTIRHLSLTIRLKNPIKQSKRRSNSRIMMVRLLRTTLQVLGMERMTRLKRFNEIRQTCLNNKQTISFHYCNAN